MVTPKERRMIYFIGDKPSKCNVDPRIAFVGTNSYRTLLLWIHAMNLSINDTMLFNSDMFVKQLKRKKLIINEEDQIVALGKEASIILDEEIIPHFRIPHPSGLNRSLNDPKLVNKFLKECKAYVLQK